MYLYALHAAESICVCISVSRIANRYVESNDLVNMKHKENLCSVYSIEASVAKAG